MCVMTDVICHNQSLRVLIAAPDRVRLLDTGRSCLAHEESARTWLQAGAGALPLCAGGWRAAGVLVA